MASYDSATLKVTERFSKAILLPMFVYGDYMSVDEIAKSTNLNVCPHTFEYTVACESIHPVAIFLILLPYNLELNWIFGGFLSFDIHNMPTTLKMQNNFYCETNNK